MHSAHRHAATSAPSRARTSAAVCALAPAAAVLALGSALASLGPVALQPAHAGLACLGGVWFAARALDGRLPRVQLPPPA